MSTDISPDALPIPEVEPKKHYESGAQKRKHSAFRQISAVGLEAKVVRGIQSRVSILEKDQDRAKKHFKRSLLTAALILDYKARNSANVEDLKAAVDGLIKVVGQLFPKAPAKKKP